MTAFTVLGVLWFWIFCWEVGYLIAMACDAKARLDKYLEPIASEMEVLLAALKKVEV